MIARVILAVLLCGATAGFAMGVMQQARLTPVILFAETFENTEPAAATAAHTHAEQEAGQDTATPQTGHTHNTEAWMPADGLERSLYTFSASILAGAGFAAILAGIAFLAGMKITRQNGWVWGLCGFLAFSLAPSAGLPPELPGMPAADTTLRQIWWVLTVAATSIALWLLAVRRESWAIVAALALAVVPHIIGAPQPANHASLVPAPLAAQFAGLVIAANAMMWLIIGTLLGRFMPQLETEKTA
jgi:cobalt transporter subunit CbtA